MPIDSINLRSNTISYEACEILETCPDKLGFHPDDKLKWYQCGDKKLHGNVAKGEQLKGKIVGPWKNGITITIPFQKRVKETGLHGGKSYTTRNNPCDPFMFMYGSASKAAQGHNIFGGPETIIDAIKQIILPLQSMIKTPLPGIDEYEIDRLDHAEGWDMGSKENALAFISKYEHVKHPQLNTETFPTHRVKGQAIETVLWTTPHGKMSFKVYHKGAEYKAKDFKKDAKLYGLKYATIKQAIADCIVRFEVLFRKDYLLELTDGKPVTVMNLSMNDVKQKFYEHLEKVNVTPSNGLKLARTRETVKRRLAETEGITPSMAQKLFNLWHWLSDSPYEQVKADYSSKESFKKHKRALVKAGIAWDGVELAEMSNEVISNIVNFVPRADSPKRIHGELLEKYERMIADLELPTGLEANL